MLWRNLIGLRQSCLSLFKKIRSWVVIQAKRKIEMLRLMFVLVIIQSITSSPLRFARERELENNRAINYLTRYGYIRNPTSDSKHDLFVGLKKFQVFFKLPATGILDEATLDLMSIPRCGVSDSVLNKNRYTVGSHGISSNPITYLITNTHKNLQPSDVNEDVAYAMSLWGKAAKKSFVQSIVFPNILLTFSPRYHLDGNPFDGPLGVLAHAFFPSDIIYGSDVHYDNEENWTTGPENPEAIDFYSVTLHELGHSLGLGHSAVQTAIMYPYYQYFSKNRTLDPDDVAGISAIYSSN